MIGRYNITPFGEGFEDERVTYEIKRMAFDERLRRWHPDPNNPSEQPPTWTGGTFPTTVGGSSSLTKKVFPGCFDGKESISLTVSNSPGKSFWSQFCNGLPQGGMAIDFPQLMPKNYSSGDVIPSTKGVFNFTKGAGITSNGLPMLVSTYFQVDQSSKLIEAVGPNDDANFTMPVLNIIYIYSLKTEVVHELPYDFDANTPMPHEPYEIEKRIASNKIIASTSIYEELCFDRVDEKKGMVEVFDTIPCVLFNYTQWWPSFRLLYQLTRRVYKMVPFGGHSPVASFTGRGYTFTLKNSRSMNKWTDYDDVFDDWMTHGKNWALDSTMRTDSITKAIDSTEICYHITGTGSDGFAYAFDSLCDLEVIEVELLTDTTRVKVRPISRGPVGHGRVNDESYLEIFAGGDYWITVSQDDNLDYLSSDDYDINVIPFN